MSKVSGTALWVCVIEPNTKFDHEWSVDLIVSEKAAKKFEENGIKVKDPKDVTGAEEYAQPGEKVVKIKQKVYKKDGTKFNAPYVRDTNGNPFGELIGNGSKLIVEFRISEWQFGPKKGKSAYLNGVVVKEHVSFHKDDNDDFDSDEDNSDSNESPFDEEF